MQMDRIVPMARLRRLFDVTTSYVVHKLLLLLFPLRRHDWTRRTVLSDAGDAYVPSTPRNDINAPDLYIPSTDAAPRSPVPGRSAPRAADRPSTCAPCSQRWPL